jgi:hypothetical protein
MLVFPKPSGNPPRSPIVEMHMQQETKALHQSSPPYSTEAAHNDLFDRYSQEAKLQGKEERDVKNDVKQKISV